MADDGSILVTGAAGQLGAVGRTVTGLLLERGLPVRAMVRREDDRAAALRAAGAEVVVGDLLEPADVYRVVSGCRRVYFGMSVSPGYLEASVTMAAVAREVGVDALVNMSQMTVSQMSSRTPPRALSSGSTGSASCANRIGRVDVFIPRRCPNGCSLFVVFTQGGGQASARACETVWSTVMAKFLFIYRESTVSRAQPSPEEMQALAAAWGTWMQKFSSAIVPGGDGLKHTGRLVKAGLVTDGPYVEAKEIIVSFAVIQADDYDAALAIARACPPGHAIEIRELAGYA